MIQDSYIMFKRCLRKAMRSPEAVIVALVVPVVMMVMFGFVFGGVADLGEISYINFIVPGIIIQCVVNASQTSAYSVYNDMTTGIIDRFRSMAISKSAFITGHVVMSVMRSVVVTAATIGGAFVIGFRPVASATDWLIASGILFLFIIAITWITVIIGLVAADNESINGFAFLFMVFSFISSAFAPTDTFPAALRIFANAQPMTPIINTLRALMLGFELGADLWIALAWCVGLIAGGSMLAVRIYKSKLTR